MEPQTQGERIAANLATLAANSTHLRRDFDAHRTDVRLGFEKIDARLKTLEDLQAQQIGAVRERGRLLGLVARVGEKAVPALLGAGGGYAVALAHALTLPRTTP